MLKREVVVIHIPNNISQRITVLAGASGAISNEPVEIFSDSSMQFLSHLSRRLLADPASKVLPDVATFAYWCRQANLIRMRASYMKDERLRMGLGLTFHICPANVPVNFAFSMAFGLLSGNSCVLRLPSKASATIDLLVRVIQSLLEETVNEELQSRLTLMRFDRDDEISRFWMSAADGRVVWGGDETVKHMRTFHSKSRSREVAFSDRYSLCALNPLTILEMDAPVFKIFCGDLFNDIYLMDQAACSSPQLIAWIGTSENVHLAQLRLWPEVVKIAKLKYELQAVHAIDKFVHACRSAATEPNVQEIQRHENLLYRLRLSQVNTHQDECRGYFGTIHEVILQDLDALACIVNERYQTLTIQGFGRLDVRNWVIHHRLRGIDRVVPVGRALDMNIIWDGYDMVGSLSRLIEV